MGTGEKLLDGLLEVPCPEEEAENEESIDKAV